MTKQIQIHDAAWDEEMRVLVDRFVEMVKNRYPTIYEKARKRCESGMMPNPPCESCVVGVAKAHGLRTEL